MDVQRTLLSVFITLLLTLCAFQAQGAVYLTGVDNEDNYGTGNPDYDMGETGSGCVYNFSTIHPVEFKIDVTGALPQQNAYLSVFITDIDWPAEKNEVFLNGHSLGYATGTDNHDGSTLFVVPDLSWINSGANTVSVNIDTLSSSWCAWVGSGQLIIDEGQGNGSASITALTTNKTGYDWGESVDVSLEVDTTLTTQETRIELVVRDAQGNIHAFDSNPSAQYWPVTGTQLEPYGWSFVLPAEGPAGIWSINAVIYDLQSGKFQSLKNAFIVVPATAAAHPVVTAITPNKAALHEDASVTITGSNFMQDVACTIGGVAVKNLVLVDNTTLTATIDTTLLGYGSHDVTCTTGYGTNTLAGAFTVEHQNVMSSVEELTSAGAVSVTASGGGGGVLKGMDLVVLLLLAAVKLFLRGNRREEKLGVDCGRCS